jgi:murein L,D-transpeptidase YcbB/YkuD
MKKTMKRVLIAALVASVGFSLAAAPAQAQEAQRSDARVALPSPVLTVSDDAVPAPPGVSEAKWSETLNEARVEFGDGDQAYLEASKDVAARAGWIYCDAQGSWMPGDGRTYRFPFKAGYGSACYLESGLNNGAVQLLQRSLNLCYGRGLTVDGSFGPATKSALQYAQAQHGITADGIWGPITRKTVKLASTDARNCRAYPG